LLFRCVLKLKKRDFLLLIHHPHALSGQQVLPHSDGRQLASRIGKR
jgi:hypothetical protein